VSINTIIGVKLFATDAKPANYLLLIAFILLKTILTIGEFDQDFKNGW
jgi:hypothetical protein